MSMTRWLSVAAIALLAALPSLCAADVPPITIQGTTLQQNGQRWYAHGVTYDYTVDDSSSSEWNAAMNQLFQDVPNINTIRIYNVDPDKSYQQFMDAMQQRGVYVIVPLTPSSGYCVLNRAGTPPLSEQTCYPSCLLSFAQRVVNQFASHSNVLGFMVGNEVILSESNWAAAACVKGLVRDLKSYMKSCSFSRQIPLIYSDADGGTSIDSPESNLRRKADYLTCGPSEERIDIFGPQLYRWCSTACTYESCGFKSIQDYLSGVGVPIVLTETGCEHFYYDPDTINRVGQRQWKEIPVIFGQSMARTFSGALAYSYCVLGGAGFSFYRTGAQDNVPSTQKTCGFSGQNQPQGCNVDFFSNQLNAVLQQGLPDASIADATTRTQSNPVCRAYPNADLDMPATRQFAPGYVQVLCPNGATPATPPISTTKAQDVPAPVITASPSTASTASSTITVSTSTQRSAAASSSEELALAASSQPTKTTSTAPTVNQATSQQVAIQASSTASSAAANSAQHSYTQSSTFQSIQSSTAMQTSQQQQSSDVVVAQSSDAITQQATATNSDTNQAKPVTSDSSDSNPEFQTSSATPATDSESSPDSNSATSAQSSLLSDSSALAFTLISSSASNQVSNLQTTTDQAPVQTTTASTLFSTALSQLSDSNTLSSSSGSRLSAQGNPSSPQAENQHVNAAPPLSVAPLAALLVVTLTTLFS